jgi:hypothetical protein
MHIMWIVPKYEGIDILHEDWETVGYKGINFYHEMLWLEV